MERKTKIIATIGPASNKQETINNLARAGMDIARLNFSHSDHKTHKENIQKIRSAEKAVGKPIAILADLCGPKIRVGALKDSKPIALSKGQILTFTPEGKASGNVIPVTYPELAKDVRAGDIILLDDGNISVKVTEVAGDSFKAKVIFGDKLKEHKGINLPDITLSRSPITKKDEEDLKFALENGSDFVGLSFVQKAEDIAKAKMLIGKAGYKIPVIAKIERRAALQNISAILKETDAVMIARGDLGVETPLERVPILQKQIITLGAKFHKPVIVATQMLESMIELDRPTRAEVSDVANSVFDGADAVMLSGETAAGKNPINALETMVGIVEASEESKYSLFGNYELEDSDDTSQFATTRAACFASDEAKAKAIVVFTMTGKSALFISKQRPRAQIIAVTSSVEVARRLNLYHGVIPLKVAPWKTIDSMISNGLKSLKDVHLVDYNDKVVVVCGTTTTPGATNMIKILKV